MIVPPLSELLYREQLRHYDEVGAINRFHKFMTEFEDNMGEINGKVWKLRGISVAGNLASFENEQGDTYFFDGNKKPTRISGVGDEVEGAPV